MVKNQTIVTSRAAATDRIVMTAIPTTLSTVKILNIVNPSLLTLLQYRQCSLGPLDAHHSARLRRPLSIGETTPWTAQRPRNLR